MNKENQREIITDNNFKTQAYFQQDRKIRYVMTDNPLKKLYSNFLFLFSPDVFLKFPLIIFRLNKISA